MSKDNNRSAVYEKVMKSKPMTTEEEADATMVFGAISYMLSSCGFSFGTGKNREKVILGNSEGSAVMLTDLMETLYNSVKEKEPQEGAQVMVMCFVHHMQLMLENGDIGFAKLMKKMVDSYIVYHEEGKGNQKYS